MYSCQPTAKQEELGVGEAQWGLGKMEGNSGMNKWESS